MHKEAREIVGVYSKSCMVEGCKAHSMYKVDGKVWATGFTDKKKHKPANLHIGVTVCEEHKNFPTVKHFFTPESKAQINQCFVMQGFVPPAWKTVELSIVPLTAEDLGEEVQ